MPALQVRDFPEELYEQLRTYAAANHRSMAQQTIIAVEQMIHGNNGNGNAATAEGGTGVVINFDTEAKRQARIKKYEELFKRIDASNARILEKRNGEAVPLGLVTEWIRADRDNNHGHEINLDLPLAEDKEVSRAYC